MKCLTKIIDVDDDDEYMNVAAAHAAFVMAVSAVKMYWLLRHAQHACDINIHMLHPLPEKKSACLCRFLQRAAMLALQALY